MSFKGSRGLRKPKVSFSHTDTLSHMEMDNNQKETTEEGGLTQIKTVKKKARLAYEYNSRAPVQEKQKHQSSINHHHTAKLHIHIDFTHSVYMTRT